MEARTHNLVSRAFPSKNGWGALGRPTHFLREKPWGQGCCTQTEPNLFAVADPGVGPGGRPPLIIRLNWGPKGRKNLFVNTGPPPRPPPYLRVWMTGPHPLCEGLDPPLLCSGWDYVCDAGQNGIDYNKRVHYKFPAINVYRALSPSSLWRYSSR